VIDIAPELAAALGPVLLELRLVHRELAEVKTMLPPRLRPLKEAALAIGVDPRTLVSMASRGECTVRRAGRKILVDMSSLRGPTPELVAAAARRAVR
jgi:hypothetical protein